MRSLQVYNGAELLLPLNDLDATSFQLLPIEGATYLDAGGVAGIAAASFHQQARYNWQRRLGSLFMGLREYAVVDSDATLSMKVQAFAGQLCGTGGVSRTGSLYRFRFASILVCEILTDKVYGNPRVPSPAARAGALVKLGASETATTSSATNSQLSRSLPPDGSRPNEFSYPLPAYSRSLTGRSRRKKAIVLPYAAIQHMAPGELVWESSGGTGPGED